MLEEKLASPTYVAVKLSLPSDRIEVGRVATELFVGALAIRVVPEYSVTVSPLGTDGVTVAVNVIGVPTGQVTLFPLGSEDFKETEVAVVANAVEPENKTTRQKRVNR